MLYDHFYPLIIIIIYNGKIVIYMICIVVTKLTCMLHINDNDIAVVVSYIHFI